MAEPIPSDVLSETVEEVEEPSPAAESTETEETAEPEETVPLDKDMIDPETTESMVADEEEFDTDMLFTGWLPKGVIPLKSETEPNELLQRTISDYYEIPEEYWGETKYYYNYVDLNGDGAEEIFAVVLGSFVSGTGGSSALWCQEYEGNMTILQAFTLVNTPIIITKDAANGQQYGARDLYLQRSGGTETEIVKLTCKDGAYTNVADAETVESIEEIEGTAIIANNIIEDMENGNFLTLADK